jgi:hypothetical protein
VTVAVLAGLMREDLQLRADGFNSTPPQIEVIQRDGD